MLTILAEALLTALRAPGAADEPKNRRDYRNWEENRRDRAARS